MNEKNPAPRRVLFVCIENSCRSQIAEAFARVYGEGRIEAHSAGSRPSGQVNPVAIASMAEIGYDLGSHRSKSLDEVPDVEFDRAITMGCGDECPLVRAKEREDWQIPDPKELDPEAFAAVRDEIGRRVREMCHTVSVVHRLPPTPGP